MLGPGINIFKRKNIYILGNKKLSGKKKLKPEKGFFCF